MMTKIFSALLASIVLFSLTRVASVAAQPTDSIQENIPSEQVSHLREARRLRKNGEYSDAIKQLEQILSAKPNYYNAQLNLALAYYNDNKLGQALEAFGKALEIRKSEEIEDYQIFNMVGWVHLEMGDFTQAEEHFKEALKHENKLSFKTKKVLYNNIGLLYLYINKLDEAEAYLKIAVEKYNNQGAAKNLDLVYASRVSELETLKSHIRWSIVHEGVELKEDGELLPIGSIRYELLATQPEERLGYQQIAKASDRDLLSAVREVLEEPSSNDETSVEDETP